MCQDVSFIVVGYQVYPSLSASIRFWHFALLALLKSSPCGRLPIFIFVSHISLCVGRALCKIQLLPVTHVLVDTWMLTVKPVYKLSNVPDDLKWTTNT